MIPIPSLLLLGVVACLGIARAGEEIRLQNQPSLTAGQGACLKDYISDAKKFDAIRYGETERYDEGFYDNCAKIRDVAGQEKAGLITKCMSIVQNARGEKFCHGAYSIVKVVSEADVYDFSDQVLLNRLLAMAGVAFMVDSENPMRIQEQVMLYRFLQWKGDKTSGFFFPGVYAQRLKELADKSAGLIDKYNVLAHKIEIPPAALAPINRPKDFVIPTTPEEEEKLNPQCKRYFGYMKLDQTLQVYLSRIRKLEQIKSQIERMLSQTDNK